MAKYKTDREFTDYVHDNIALKYLYPRLNWTDPSHDEVIDIMEGIDYIFFSENKKISIQERFRDKKYYKYNDFTLRYQRPWNKREDRKKSEFYKIKADYLVYGIINQSKEDYKYADNFLKVIVIDLNVIRELYKNKYIIIEETHSKTCRIKDDTLICPINYNIDRSSSFIVFDIIMLDDLFSNEFIKYQHGYLKT